MRRGRVIAAAGFLALAACRSSVNVPPPDVVPADTPRPNQRQSTAAQPAAPGAL
jgi:hypothetical protein